MQQPYVRDRLAAGDGPSLWLLHPAARGADTPRGGGSGRPIGVHAPLTERRPQVSNQPVRARNHVGDVVRFNPRQIKRAVGEVEGFNAKFAVIITSGVGTMACAYAFALLAFVSLPAIL